MERQSIWDLVLGIRLSVMAPTFFVVFVIAVFTLKQQDLTAGQLALFSVNSFLFGYYFNLLLDSQKNRIATLNSVTRQEEMTILDILTQSHLLSAANRHTLKVKLRTYLLDVIGNKRTSADNVYYDELLYWTKKVKNEDPQVLGIIYARVSDTQDNRSQIANMIATRIYSHEWMVVGVLFSITIYFAVQTHFGDSIFFGVMLAILCAGLCMLMAILVKYATLTHKEAKRMWNPLRELDKNHFDDVPYQEVIKERQRLRLANAKAGASQ